MSAVRDDGLHRWELLKCLVAREELSELLAYEFAGNWDQVSAQVGGILEEL